MVTDISKTQLTRSQRICCVMNEEKLEQKDGNYHRCEDYAVEEDEWEQIKALPLIDLSGKSSSQSVGIPLDITRVTSSVDINEVLSYFETLDVSQQMTRIKPFKKRTGFWGLISEIFCMNPTKLDLSLHEERNRVFAIALQSFDNSDSMQTRFLVTIYRKLTGSALIDCRRFGNHWEDIGFQGTDPATDLRGVGLLGLLQILFLILSSDTSLLSKEIYRLSLDPKQHFPFAIMSTNITQIAIQILREGLLNKECNEAKCVLKVFNWFYSGVFYRLYKIWKENNKTIVDSGYVLRDIRRSIRQNVKQVIVDVLNYKNDLQTKTNVKDSEEDITFSNLGDMFAELEEYEP